MGAAETRGSRFDRLVPGNGQLIALLSRPARAHAFVCRHDRLLLRARGRDAEAIDEFRSAIYAPTFGYTRTNLELAKLYLRNRRARDAVAVLQPALRGPLDGSNLYVDRTELQDLLARAWNAAGGRDSARVHYQVVAKALVCGR